MIPFPENKKRRNTKQPFPCNDFCFSEITEESAYWAGFLLADGTVEYKSQATPKISCRLAAKDISHVMKLRTFLGSTKKLLVNDATNQTKKKYPSAFTSVSSLKIAQDLYRYGITPNKTRTAEPTDLVKTNKHFWRGVIDGDGYLKLARRVRSHNGGKTSHIATDYSLSLCGSERTIELFLDYCRNITPTTAKIRFHNGAYYADISGSHAIKLVEHFYGDSTVHLDRKYIKAIEMIDDFQSKVVVV